MNKSIIASLLLFCCSLLLTGPAFAANDQTKTIGSVVALRGKADVQRQGKTLTLKVKDKLYRQDTIKTGERSRLQVMFLDNTIVSMGQNTEINLAEYAWQPDKNEATMKTKVKEGVFRVMGGAITKVAPQNFTTETPTATIGIRGSMYAGRVGPGECRVVFQGGKGITVTNDIGQVVITKPGFGTRAVADERPEPPARVSAEEINQLNADLAPAADDQEAGAKENNDQSANSTDEQASNSDDQASSDESTANSGDEATSAEASTDESASGTGDEASTEEASTNETASGSEDGAATDSTASAETASNSGDATQTETAGQQDAGAGTQDSGLSGGSLADSGQNAPDAGSGTQDTQLNAGNFTDISQTTTDTGSATNIQNPVIVDTIQPTVPDVPIPPPNDQSSTETLAPAIQYSGLSSASLYDLSASSLSNNWQGPLTLVQDPTNANQYAGTIAADTNFPVSFDLAGAAASGTYSRLTSGRTVSVLNTGVALNLSTVTFLNSKDFFILSGAAGFVPPFVIGGQDYGYQDLAFAGKPASVMPTSGVGNFRMAINGSINYATQTPNSRDPIAAIGEVWVDFGNKTVIGRIHGYDRTLYRVKNGIPLEGATLFDSMINADGTSLADPKIPFGAGELALDKGIFFGTLSGNALTNITFLAGGDRSNSATGGGLEISSSLLNGNIYGTNANGLGWTLNDSVFSGETNNIVGSASMIGAGIETARKPSTLVAKTYKGYAIGVNEQWDASGTLSTSVFGNKNDLPGDFTYTLGADGSVNGSVQLSDNSGGLLDMTIGGPGKGVAIDNKQFAAEMNDATVGKGLLFSNLGFNTEPLSFKNVTWGYWMLSPGGANAHYDGLWIAGEQTSQVQARLNDLLTNTQSLLGRYDGQAFLQSVEMNNHLVNEQVGSAHFEVNFQDSTFWGALDFGPVGSALHFDINNGTIDANGFSASDILVDSLAPDAAGLYGNFYGPGNELDTMAGSFFSIVDTTHYTGVFGADLPATGLETFTSVALSGRFHSDYFDQGLANSTLSYTPLSGQNAGGSFAATVTDATGTTMDVSFALPIYDPTTTVFTPIEENSFPITRNLLGLDRTFDAELVTSPSGDFAYLALPFGSFSDAGSSYIYQELSFVGEPTALASIPTDGIDIFHGKIQNVFTDQLPTGLEKSETTPISLLVNWKNKKFIGSLDFMPSAVPGDPPGLSHVFVMGDINGNQLVNVRFIGHGFDPFTDDVSAVNGTSFGQLYGTNYQGIGFAGTGSMLSLLTDMSVPQTAITTIGATHRFNDPLTTASAQSGTANLEGFVVGMSENIQDLANQRRLFMNSAPSLFSMTLDRDNGTVTGSLSAENMDNPAATLKEKLNNLEIGGSNGSAYISDKGFIAVIGDSSGTAIDSLGSTGTLKPEGNVLITEDPGQQSAASYATWGYWELAYQDPANSGHYHLHEPGALWIAGERTPASEVQNLIDTNAVGTYSGMAQGIHIDTSTATQDVRGLPSGTVNLTVNFGNTAVANAVTGNITFPSIPAAGTDPGLPGVTLNIGSAASTLTTSGFTGQITNAGASPDSTVNGAFFGPNAKTVGGNFRADFSSERYLGIFAGDKP